MSEQTPDHASDDAAALPEAEPSMEDILASIRQIIADDADPVPLDGPSVVDTPPVELAAEPVELAEPAPTTVAAVSDDALDIDALLSDLDVVEPEAPPVSLPDMPDDAVVLDAIDIPDADDAPLVADSVTMPEALGQRAAQGLLAGGAAAAATPAPRESDPELDSLLDSLLDDLDAPLEAEVVVDPGEAVIAAEAAEARVTPELDTPEDMDLVRSLMDDLTDEDLVVEAEADADRPAAAAVDPMPEPDILAAPEPVVDTAEDDILDSILDMTLDDEIADQPLDIPEPEPEREPVEAVAAAMPVPDPLAAPSGPSLSDIAASAEADADAVSVPVVAAAGAALAGGAAVASGIVAAPAPAHQAKTVAEQTAPAPEPEPAIPTTPEPAPTSPEETPMPRAVRSDAILDEVTEEATASAFAELNQVVENKAVYEERGPRIGDLVQEALKPMLKEWLDANLKGIVERAVAKEVKRISSGK